MRCIHYLGGAKNAPATTLRALNKPDRRTMPIGIVLSLVALLCSPYFAGAKESTQKRSGWELSFANGLLVFKQETTVHKTESEAKVAGTTAEQDPVSDVVLQGLSEDEQASLFLLATESRFHTEVSGIVARSILTQTFRNPGDDWLSGQYQFPLPENAAVDALKIRIGRREIIGQIQEKQKAKANFQQAKAAGKKASLVSQQRPNLFTTAVANIGPHEEVEIEIQFQQQVQFDAGEFRLRLPTTITPRFGGSFEFEEGLTQVAVQPNRFNFTLMLHAGLELDYLRSLHYAADTESYGNHQWRLTAKAGQAPDRDVEFVWRYKNQQPEILHFSESREDGEYGLLMLMPGMRAPEQTIARDITFVIDTSSSMGGPAIRQAKSALLSAIEQLNKEDSFNIVEFNSHADSLWTSMLPGSERNRRVAVDYVQQLEAEGGTNIYEALERALSVQRISDNLPQLVFITDGAIGYEDELLTRLNEQLGNARLFTVGIGAAPNSYFMVEAARAGRGTYTYIAQQDQVHSRMGELFDKLAQPVLKNIEIDLAVEAEIYPEPVPDLYLGEPLLISYKSPMAVTDIKVTGDSLTKPWQTVLTQEYAFQHSGIAKHWARQKITSLMRLQRTHQKSDTETRKRVLETALKHDLVSPYTSLIAIESQSTRYQSEDARMIANLPATALGSGQHLAIAIFLLVIAALLTLWHGMEFTVHKTKGRAYVAK
ncbi:VIT domain-containing protein [Planctobacterium marinum]|uniref:Marine proteobacterial sortase target protein n=1 Tax=Planctobacterium marinum TaxID=1631968 RepID=A0AA48HII7_9ALTE|nr:marine proteobacterial sortase target protein [Planctobacterium marinum]